MPFGLGWTDGAGGSAAAAGEDSTAWVRTADWPAMPTTVANTIDILAAVTDNDSNFCALSATVVGGYTVDWGDGTVETVASGIQRDHKYTYSDADLGAVTSRGYKVAVIRVSPQAANPITAFSLGLKNATAGLAAYSNPWLEIQVNTPSCTSMAYRGGVDATWVERINILAIGAITTLSAAFQNCSSLQSIEFPAGSLVSVTSLANAFQSCSSLKTVSFPTGSLASVNTLGTAFYACSSLQSVVFPAGSLGLATSLANTFYGCYSLRYVTFPTGALAAVSNMVSAFQFCSSLRSITFPAGSISLVTSLETAFYNCYSLQSITFPAGSLASVLSLANAFQGCAIQSLVFPAGSLVSATTLASTFQSCASLKYLEFPAGSLGSVVTTTTTFSGCTNLAKIVNCSIPVSFALTCNLSAPELDAIYTSLPTVSAKTITVTGNYGTAADTPTIATAKGWTVTG